MAGSLACSCNPAIKEARTWTDVRRGVLITLDSCRIGVCTKADINMASKEKSLEIRLVNEG